MLDDIKKIAVIGAGAMGGAVVRGLIESGYPAERMWVSNPSAARLEPLKALGASTCADNCAAAISADLVIVAVKPWILPGVAAELRAVLDPRTQEVAVIVAGVSCADLSSMFRCAAGVMPLSIVMPNTAMTLRKSMTFIVKASGEPKLAPEAFAPLGAVRVIEERLLPAATALASCGIAYALRYVRAAVEGGVELGFRASEAQDIVAATIEGAAALLGQPGACAETEIDKVTTPCGLTIRGLNAMEAAGFTPAIIAGLKAGR